MIKALKQFLSQHEFARHVLTLMTGTGLAQILGVLLSVFVTRIFEREHFATLEQFSMFLVLGSVLVTGKYEFAIMKPKEESKALNLVGLSFFIALFLSLISFFIVLFFGEYIAVQTNNADLQSWLWLLPPTLLFFALFNILNYWFSRQKAYKHVAKSKVLFSLVSEPSKIVLGLLGYLSGGLIVSVVLGRVASGLFMTWNFLRQQVGRLHAITKGEMKAVAAEYKDYPRFVLAGSILSRLAQWAHIALFSYFFGIYSIAFFALSRRVFLTPLSILSVSFSQVFYQKISEMDSLKSVKRLYLKSLKNFSILGAVLLLIVFALPDNTMGFVFGEKWTETLTYLRILSFWYVANFISGSMGFLWHRLDKQKTMFYLDVTHFILIIAALLGAFYLGCTELESVVVFVVAKCVYFALNIFASFRSLNKKIKLSL